MADCKFCGAKIRWAKTMKGKLIPLDAEPVADGKFGLIVEPGDKPDLAVAAQDHHNLRYDTHFATCPMAGQARKR